MTLHAELSCLSCGYEIGDVEGERGARPEDLVFLPVHQGDRLIVDRSGHFRCPRCRSRIIPQGIAPVHRPLDPGSLYEGDLEKELKRPLAV